MNFGQKKPLETSPLGAQELRRKLAKLFALQVGTLVPMIYWYQYGFAIHSLGDQLYPLLIIVILQTILSMYFARSRFLLRRLKDIYPQVTVENKRSTFMLGACLVSPLATMALLPLLAFRASARGDRSTPLLFRNRALIPLAALTLAFMAMGRLFDSFPLALASAYSPASPLAYWTSNPTTVLVAAIGDDLQLATQMRRQMLPFAPVADARKMNTFVGPFIRALAVLSTSPGQAAGDNRQPASASERLESDISKLEGLIGTLGAPLKSPMALFNPVSFMTWVGPPPQPPHRPNYGARQFLLSA